MLGLALLLLCYGKANSEAAVGAVSSISREAVAVVVRELPAGAALLRELECSEGCWLAAELPHSWQQASATTSPG